MAGESENNAEEVARNNTHQDHQEAAPEAASDHDSDLNDDSSDCSDDDESGSEDNSDEEEDDLALQVQVSHRAIASFGCHYHTCCCTHSNPI